jgi:hypothetical protein
MTFFMRSGPLRNAAYFMQPTSAVRAHRSTRCAIAIAECLLIGGQARLECSINRAESPNASEAIVGTCGQAWVLVDALCEARVDVGPPFTLVDLVRQMTRTLSSTAA